MMTILSRSGYIIKHSWGETVNKELIIKSTMRVMSNGCVDYGTKLHIRKNWEQDVRLQSMYLDKVVRIIIKSYYYLQTIQFFVTNTFC